MNELMDLMEKQKQRQTRSGSQVSGFTREHHLQRLLGKICSSHCPHSSRFPWSFHTAFELHFQEEVAAGTPRQCIDLGQTFLIFNQLLLLLFSEICWSVFEMRIVTI